MMPEEMTEEEARQKMQEYFAQVENTMHNLMMAIQGTQVTIAQQGGFNLNTTREISLLKRRVEELEKEGETTSGGHLPSPHQ